MDAADHDVRAHGLSLASRTIHGADRRRMLTFIEHDHVDLRRRIVDEAPGSSGCRARFARSASSRIPQYGDVRRIGFGSCGSALPMVRGTRYAQARAGLAVPMRRNQPHNRTHGELLAPQYIQQYGRNFPRRR